MNERIIENAQNNYHCPVCFRGGGNVMRYKLTIKFENNSDNIWINAFPCMQSLLDYLECYKPFLQSYSIDLITES